MEISFGKRFNQFRKEKDYTQEEIADKLNVSPQAVSKWENDISYPDILSLTTIAKIFDTTVDELLGNEKKPVTYVLDQKKNLNEMIFKVRVLSKEGDKVKINLPLSIAKLTLDSDNAYMNFGNNKFSLKKEDLERIFLMIEQGVIGKLVEIESADGDIVEIYVE